MVQVKSFELFWLQQVWHTLLLADTMKEQVSAEKCMEPLFLQGKD